METNIQNKINKARHARHVLDGGKNWIRPIKHGESGARSSMLYSAKHQTLILDEFRLEQASCNRLEVESDISSYRTQALAVPYRVRAISRFSYLLFEFPRIGIGIGIWRCAAAVARDL